MVLDSRCISFSSCTPRFAEIKLSCSLPREPKVPTAMPIQTRTQVGTIQSKKYDYGHLKIQGERSASPGVTTGSKGFKKGNIGKSRRTSKTPVDLKKALFGIGKPNEPLGPSVQKSDGTHTFLPSVVFGKNGERGMRCVQETCRSFRVPE